MVLGRKPALRLLLALLAQLGAAIGGRTEIPFGRGWRWHRGDALLCGGASLVHAPERAERSRVAFGSRTPHQALRLVKVHVKALPVRVAAGELILRISQALVRGEPKKLHGLLIISHLSQDDPKKALRPRIAPV